MPRPVYLLMISVCLAACSPQNGGTASQQSTSNAAAKTVGEAPAQAGDDEQAIRALGERHAKAVAGKDTARVGEIYAEDVVYLPHDDPVEEGIAAARGAWVRGLSVPNTQIQYTPVAIEVGDRGMAYGRGTVKTTMKGKPLQPGNYLYVWRKRDGEWGWRSGSGTCKEPRRSSNRGSMQQCGSER